MESGGIRFDLSGIAGQLKERLLAVPIYQRSYAWDEDQVQEFWADVRGAFSDSHPEYFLGTLVITRQANPPRDGIIDGQQRLATTSLLLAAIRDEYKSRGDNVRADIVQKDYLATSDLVSATEVARLSLSSDDLLFFQRRVVKALADPAPSRPSHELILKAYTYLRTQITKVADDAGPDWATRLTNWVEFLKEKVKVIVLVVPSDSDAYLIFETLNDRGADLTIADLLKNYLFGHAGASLNAVRDGWMMVLGALEIPAENSIFTTFLRHYWSSVRGAVRERDLYKSIKQHVVTETQVLEFISNLQAAAELYSALLSDSHDYWDGLGPTVKGNVETLLRLELEQNRPLLLAVLQHFTEPEKKRLLKALVSWSVRGLIVGGIGGGTAEKAYCSAAVKVRTGTVKTTEELLVELAHIVPSDTSFEDTFKIASVTKGGLARYYLIALEKGSKNEAEPEFVPNDNEEQVNLEHVLPKRAKQSDWGAAFTADERKEYVHRIGNLALLKKGPNGRIGNKAFSGKKVVLSASAFELTKEIGAELDWTKQTIAARQGRLAALAVKVWPR
jgi:hypothetical protein